MDEEERNEVSECGREDEREREREREREIYRQKKTEEEGMNPSKQTCPSRILSFLLISDVCSAPYS